MWIFEGKPFLYLVLSFFSLYLRCFGTTKRMWINLFGVNNTDFKDFPGWPPFAHRFFFSIPLHPQTHATTCVVESGLGWTLTSWCSPRPGDRVWLHGSSPRLWGGELHFPPFERSFKDWNFLPLIGDDSDQIERSFLYMASWAEFSQG